MPDDPLTQRSERDQLRLAEYIKRTRDATARRDQPMALPQDAEELPSVCSAHMKREPGCPARLPSSTARRLLWLCP